MVNLLDAIAQALDCTRNGVKVRLNHPLDRQKITQMYHLAKLRTLYKDRNGLKETFYFGGLSTKSAAEQLAYGKLRRVYNVTVAQHMYVRHRIQLNFPFHLCVIEKQMNKPAGTPRYYPLELVEVVNDEREEEKNLEDIEKDQDEWGEKNEEPDDMEQNGRIGKRMLNRMARGLFKELPIAADSEEDDDPNSDEEICAGCGGKLINGRHHPPWQSRLPPISFTQEDDLGEFEPGTSEWAEEEVPFE